MGLWTWHRAGVAAKHAKAAHKLARVPTQQPPRVVVRTRVLYVLAPARPDTLPSRTDTRRRELANAPPRL